MGLEYLYHAAPNLFEVYNPNIDCAQTACDNHTKQCFHTLAKCARERPGRDDVMVGAAEQAAQLIVDIVGDLNRYVNATILDRIGSFGKLKNPSDLAALKTTLLEIVCTLREAKASLDGITGHEPEPEPDAPSYTDGLTLE